jgi:hypothetical protein
MQGGQDQHSEALLLQNGDTLLHDAAWSKEASAVAALLSAVDHGTKTEVFLKENNVRLKYCTFI